MFIFSYTVSWNRSNWAIWCQWHHQMSLALIFLVNMWNLAWCIFVCLVLCLNSKSTFWPKLSRFLELFCDLHRCHGCQFPVIILYFFGWESKRKLSVYLALVLFETKCCSGVLLLFFLKPKQILWSETGWRKKYWRSLCFRESAHFYFSGLLLGLRPPCGDFPMTQA